MKSRHIAGRVLNTRRGRIGALALALGLTGATMAPAFAQTQNQDQNQVQNQVQTQTQTRERLHTPPADGTSSGDQLRQRDRIQDPTRDRTLDQTKDKTMDRSKLRTHDRLSNPGMIGGGGGGGGGRH